MSSLDLALIGNGTIAALIGPDTDVAWACFPRFDGDPLFCGLLQRDTPSDGTGHYRIELAGVVRTEQDYLPHTPLLITRCYDAADNAIEITDFAPRFEQHDRMFAPMTLVRRVRRLRGTPRVRIRLRPASGYGARAAAVTSGSNHIRFVADDVVVRLHTTAPVTSVLEATEFCLDDAVTLILGPDETIAGSIADVGRTFEERTIACWKAWVRNLAIPFEWQAEVIRAAITLKLNTFEDTGAIIAAVTTSIPEAPESGRNWDYRYCWLRDAYFVVHALNRLGATLTMERYLRYIIDIVATADGGRLQPVYGIGGRPVPEERVVPTLAGYRGMGPVRVGNQASLQVQHDVYGSAILTASHMFFDHRLGNIGNVALYERLEPLGHQALDRFDQPDAGIWELRGTSRVHTFSAIMCWAAADRLARIGTRLGLAAERPAFWARHAERMRTTILDACWNEDVGGFVSTFGGTTLDASLLQMHAVGFIAPTDPRFVRTVETIGRVLGREGFLYRYDERDDFGHMENAFLVCTFWYVEALAAIGRRDEARALFERLLRCRNRHGLLAEDLDPRTGEQWGNFVQTYSMVGLITAARRLSISWDEAV